MKLTKDERNSVKEMRNILDEVLEKDNKKDLESAIIFMRDSMTKIIKDFLKATSVEIVTDQRAIREAFAEIEPFPYPPFFEQEVKGGQVVSDREITSLEYWEKELEKMDKKKRRRAK